MAKCRYEEEGKCYKMMCFDDTKCGARDERGVVNKADDRAIRIRMNSKNNIRPKVVVMQPKVVNKDNTSS